MIGEKMKEMMCREKERGDERESIGVKGGDSE